ncbi:MAG: hypothetical protein J6I52_02450 [Prevotella sp.]|nr:hypothetical protein [Prevotella sp.]
MKKLFIVVMLFMGLTVKAQDVVITKEGDAFKVYGLEVSSSSVYYRESQDENAPIVKKNKSDLLMIKYNDGRKEIIGDENQPSYSDQSTTSALQEVPTEFNTEDKAANEEAMGKWNTFPENKMKATKKKAIILYCVLRPDKDSRIADSNVELSFKSGKQMSVNSVRTSNFIVSVKNKTKNTIYLDLGNTFFIRGEQAEAYYIPTANSSTSGTSSGVGVNMGAVAGAMGIGGAAGKLASGINVGRGSSQYNTTITYSQRVIAIPPMSSKELEPKTIIPFGKNYPDPTQFFGNSLNMKKRPRYGTGTALPHLQDIGTTINIGAVTDINEGQVPIKVGTFLTYSMTEDIKVSRTLQANFSVRRIIGVPELKLLGVPSEAANLKNLTSQQLNDPYFLIWQAEE